MHSIQPRRHPCFVSARMMRKTCRENHAANLAKGSVNGGYQLRVHRAACGSEMNRDGTIGTVRVTLPCSHNVSSKWDLSFELSFAATATIPIPEPFRTSGRNTIPDLLSCPKGKYIQWNFSCGGTLPGE